MNVDMKVLLNIIFVISIALIPISLIAKIWSDSDIFDKLLGSSVISAIAAVILYYLLGCNETKD
jgi:hypothetical protein